jgi:hypothetical protein
VTADFENLLDELAAVFARAAVDAYLCEIEVPEARKPASPTKSVAGLS